MASPKILPLVTAALLASGCSHSDSPNVARSAAGADSIPLVAGEVRIVTSDTGVDLALVHDSISGGLAPKTLAQVRHSLDTATVPTSGLGASIGSMVKGAVSKVVGTRVSVPLSKVKDVRYENGKLVFEWNGAPVTMFENTKVNGKPVLESFRVEDAKRFADAVMARKRALGQ